MLDAPLASPPVASKPPLTFGQLFNIAGMTALHVGVGIAIYRGVTWKLVAIAAISHVIRMFGITGCYHRYFAHRTFKTSRAFQFVLALIGTTTTQKGPLWWAGIHRLHHKYSDTERDVHSPSQRGFWHSHMAWWLGREHEVTNTAVMSDFARFPELRWLDRWTVLGPLTLIGALLWFGGFDVFLWGYCVSTVTVLHTTFAVNSIAHMYGSRRFVTTDTSRNNVPLALLGLGEGWHNNHHHYQSSGRLGFYWWEIDVGYWILKAFAAVGLIWDLRVVPPHVLTRDLVSQLGAPSPADAAPLVPEVVVDVVPAPVT